MTDTLRRIAAVWLQHDGPYSKYQPDTDLTILACDCGWIGETDEYQEYADHFADTLIRELGNLRQEPHRFQCGSDDCSRYRIISDWTTDE